MVLAAAFLFFFVALSAAQDRCSTSGPIDGRGECTLPLSSYRDGLSFTAEDGNILLIVEASDRTDFGVTYDLDDGYLLEAGPNGIVVTSQLNNMAVRGAFSVLLSFVCIGYFALFGQASMKSAIFPIALLLLALPLVRPQGPYDGTITLNVPVSQTGYRLTIVNATVENPSNLLELDCSPSASNCQVLVIDCDDGLEFVVSSLLDIAVCVPITVCDPGQYVSSTGCRNCSNGGENYVCPTGRYQTGVPCNGTTTVDTQTCDNCTICAIGKYIGTACNATNDTVCTNCTTCEEGTFQNGTVCNGTSLRDTQECDNCTVCGEDEFEFLECVGNNDTVCKECTVCEDYQFREAVCSEDEDTVCTDCTNCTDTQFIIQQCGEDDVSDNRICGECGGCASGFYQDGEPCDGLGFVNDSTTCIECQTCEDDFEYNAGEICDGSSFKDRDCQRCETCEDEQFETQACGSGIDGTEDRECQYCKNCTAGQYISQECTDTEDAECAACKICEFPQYQTGANCTGVETSDVQQPCAQCRTCEDEQFIERQCTRFENTECEDCTFCDEGQFFEGAYCNGLGLSNTQSECEDCLNTGRDEYACDKGFFKDGERCTGEDNFDSQTCTECTVCTEGQFQSGEDCSGEGDEDTQSCTDCRTCRAGTQYRTGNCGPTLRTNYECETCRRRCPSGGTLISNCTATADIVCSNDPPPPPPGGIRDPVILIPLNSEENP